MRATIERTFYRDVINGLTPREVAFVIALADLGPAQHRLSAVADRSNSRRSCGSRDGEALRATWQSSE